MAEVDHRLCKGSLITEDRNCLRKPWGIVQWRYYWLMQDLHRESLSTFNLWFVVDKSLGMHGLMGTEKGSGHNTSLTEFKKCLDNTLCDSWGVLCRSRNWIWWSWWVISSSAYSMVLWFWVHAAPLKKQVSLSVNLAFVNGLEKAEKWFNKKDRKSGVCLVPPINDWSRSVRSCNSPWALQQKLL